MAGKAVKALVNYYTHEAPLVASLVSAKNITAKFCPYQPKSLSIRYMLQWLTSQQAVMSNPDCKIKTHILHDGTKPAIEIEFFDGTGLMIKCEHLKFTEMQSLYIEHVEPKDEVLKELQAAELAKSSGKLKKFTR